MGMRKYTIHHPKIGLITILSSKVKVYNNFIVFENNEGEMIATVPTNVMITSEKVEVF